MDNEKRKEKRCSASDSALQLIVKGFVIGSSMSVPGVSGGTMAILLGVYDGMLKAVSGFFQNIRKNALYLLNIMLGAGIGIGSLSFLISWLLERMPVPVSFFFIGAVAGGIPVLVKEIQKGKMSSKESGRVRAGWQQNAASLLYFAAGAACVLAVSNLPEGVVLVQKELTVQSFFPWAVTGIIVALALVLPGISTSHMLLVMGLYETTLTAIRQADIVFLLCLGGFSILGVFLVTKPLEWVIHRYVWQSYSVILGFVAGSVQAVFTELMIPALPPAPDGKWVVYTVLASVVLFAAGVIFIRSIEQKMKNV